MADYRVSSSTPPHPADGMTATVQVGDGAQMDIMNPQSFEDGGAEWVMRYGNPESIRYTVASLLSSFDYLLSTNINMTEATRRLRLMRRARTELLTIASIEVALDRFGNDPDKGLPTADDVRGIMIQDEEDH